MLLIAHALRKSWWRWRKPVVHGCLIVARDPGGRILMIRHSYQDSPGWSLPGGGIGRRETPDTAARRELREETGLEATDLAFAGHDDTYLFGATNRVAAFAAQVAGTPRPDGREVIEARFFAEDALPRPMTIAARQAIARCSAGGRATG